VQQVLDKYTSAALAGDRTGAAELAAGLVRAARTPEQLITRLLAPSQVDVGNRWLERMCSVGAEHTATFVTESILASITVGLEPLVPVGRIIMVCAEGEWHGLPARMASELLMLQGWRVTYLGPATPAAHLRAYLADAEADAVGVSCSITANLPGAARTVHVARQLGFTVLAGGQAFGNSSRRARAIGADGWAPAIDEHFDLDALVWPRGAEPDPDGEWALIDHDRLEVTRRAMRWLSSHGHDTWIDSSDWLEHVASDVEDVVRHASAALLCDDVTVLRDHRRWLGQLLAASGVPDEVATTSFRAVAAALADVSPSASRLVADHAELTS
jgi:methanogenic corrinoid protein MtbC1